MLNITPFVRLSMRVIAGLVAWQGWLGEAEAASLLTDPELVVGVTLIVTESWYSVEKWWKART